jgi:hypothetical protein
MPNFFTSPELAESFKAVIDRHIQDNYDIIPRAYHGIHYYEVVKSLIAVYPDLALLKPGFLTAKVELWAIEHGVKHSRDYLALIPKACQVN